MILLKTTTGSLYEIDKPNNRIRRVSGEKPPTPRMAADGTWRTYQALSPLQVGAQVLIVWEFYEDAGGELHTQNTLTSPVTHIVPNATAPVSLEGLT
jgi:hypothetical protein